jgi:hypothetical protein
MSKYAKTILVLLLFLSACTKNVPNPPVVFDKPVPFGKPAGKVIGSPAYPDFVAVNPLTFDSVVNPQNTGAVKMVVRGLKDISFQDRINADIQAIYDRFLSYKDLKLLPYRSAKKEFAQRPIVIPTISFAATFNFNNLLSIVGTGSYDFYTNDTELSGYRRVSVVETLNYDLTTGKPIVLADLFTNDADVAGILDPQVVKFVRLSGSEYVDSDTVRQIFGYRTFEQVSPFKGIQGDQVFALVDYGIQLYFDYRTPEFETGAAVIQLDIPLSDLRPYFVGDQRFVSDTSPYLNEVKEYRFLMDWDLSERVSAEKKVVTDGQTLTLTTSYPKNIDAFYFDRIASLIDETQAFITSFGLGKVKFASRQVNYSKMGKYSLLDIYTGINDTNWGVYIQSRECYDASNKRLKIEDLFVKGFDFETIIRVKIEEQLGYMVGLDLMDRYAELRANLSFLIRENALVMDTYAISPVDGFPYSIEIYLPYDEIGGKNLTIFGQ